MKTILCLIAVLLLLPSLAAAAAINIEPVGERSINLGGTSPDTLWFEGGNNTLNRPWKTTYMNVRIDADTPLMAFSLYFHFNSARVRPDTTVIAAGSYFTTNYTAGTDSYFFNATVDGDTLIITGSRMDATVGQKGVTANDMVVVTNLRFWRVATTSIAGDSVSLMSGSMKFRDNGNNAITTVTIDPRGWFFAAKNMNDMDNNGIVNADDIATVLGNRGSSTTTYDSTQDGVVNADDIAAVLGARGQTY